ncbi:MAG: hypothetical protein HOM37_11940, partial [Acidimicrobiaceae bacterium]|nr:hypothetical protein [Acidimicrobiaceae bacterium]
MRWQDVCSTSPRVIGDSGRRQWDELGYLAFPGMLGDAELERLTAALGTIIEASRSMSESTHLVDLDAGHRRDSPRLRRAALIDDVDAVFWDF